MTFSEFFSLFNQTRHQGNEVYAAILYAQAVFETTANGKPFSSNLCVNYRNLFGMRPSQKREKFYQGVYQTPNNGEFAEYANHLNSLLDRIDLDEYNKTPIPTNISQAEGYMKTVLQKGYAPEAHYLPSWMSVFNRVINGEEFGAFDNSLDDSIEAPEGNDENVRKTSKFIPIVLIAVGVFLLFRYGKPILRKIPVIGRLF